MSSKATKGKKPLKESVANPKLSSAMNQANPKFVMGKPMLTIDALIRHVNLVPTFITTISIITSQVKT
jgi:hypothetical protein